MLALWKLSMSLLLKLWHFRAADSFESFTMAVDFLCQIWAKWPRVNFQKCAKNKGTSHRYLFIFKFPYRMAACRLPLECMWWRVSTGFGMWDAGSQSNACCCGQVVAAISLLCMADILLQWAVSTHRHFIHMGQQAGLPTFQIYPISHEYHKQAFFVSFHTKFFFYCTLKLSQIPWAYLVKSQSGNSSWLTWSHALWQGLFLKNMLRTHWTHSQGQVKTLRIPYFKPLSLKFYFKLHSILELLKRTKFNEWDRICLLQWI